MSTAKAAFEPKESATYKELVKIFETFAKEKPGATNDEHVALGLLFLCNMVDAVLARTRKFEGDVLERLAKLEPKPLNATPVGAMPSGEPVRVTSRAEYDAAFPNGSLGGCVEEALKGPGVTVVPLYVGDGHPALRALADQTGSYENTEDPE